MQIEKPIIRKKLRRTIAKEYYILKRKLNWFINRKSWSSNKNMIPYDYVVIEHKSFIMRPLKDVEMYLQENKKTNLAIAVENLNNLEIKPNEIFSFWKLVGRPTRSKGYLDGLVLNQGKVDKGVGGGLCQLGNLLFWIFAHSSLDIIDRHRHSFDVFPDVNRKIPFGAGATLAYNYIDFQVKNNTKNNYQLELWVDENYLNGKLTSKEKDKSNFKIEERNHLIKNQYWGGYSRHNQIFKIEIADNKVIQESLLFENHAIMMYNPFLEK